LSPVDVAATDETINSDRLSADGNRLSDCNSAVVTSVPSDGDSCLSACQSSVEQQTHHLAAGSVFIVEPYT